jgi:Tat protein secretion system quality control protein TatD with DNase activity
MARLLDLGAMLSFATTAAQPRNHRLRECLRQAPADRLLLESDAPDMFSAALVPADDHEAGRNGRNEPACVAGLYALAADLRDVDIDQLQERLWQNAAIFTTRTSDRR